MYFYRSPSAGIFLFDGKYSWRRTVHARFVTARVLRTALKSLDKFYDVSLRALFFPLFFSFSSTTNQKENADCRNSYLFIDREISNADGVIESNNREKYSGNTIPFVLINFSIQSD